MDIKKLLKKSSVSKKVWSSMTVVSVCFRMIKKRWPEAQLQEWDGYIRHNILFLRNIPRDVNIALYTQKQQLLDEINKELAAYDFSYKLKNILTK